MLAWRSLIKGQGPGLVNVLSQREWLRVDQFQNTHMVNVSRKMKEGHRRLEKIREDSMRLNLRTAELQLSELPNLEMASTAELNC